MPCEHGNSNAMKFSAMNDGRRLVKRNEWAAKECCSRINYSTGRHVNVSYFHECFCLFAQFLVLFVTLSRIASYRQSSLKCVSITPIVCVSCVNSGSWSASTGSHFPMYHRPILPIYFVLSAQLRWWCNVILCHVQMCYAKRMLFNTVESYLKIDITDAVCQSRARTTAHIAVGRTHSHWKQVGKNTYIALKGVIWWCCDYKVRHSMNEVKRPICHGRTFAST